MIQEILSELSKSPTGKNLVDFAVSNNIKIVYDKNVNAYGYYSPKDHIIALNPKTSKGMKIATLAHEIKHAVQDIQNGCSLNHTVGIYSPKDALAIYLLCEADAEATQAVVIDELESIGVKEPLRAVKKSAYSSIIRKYKVKKDYTSAFKQWSKISKIVDTYSSIFTDLLVNNLLPLARMRSKNGSFKTLEPSFILKMSELPPPDKRTPLIINTIEEVRPPIHPIVEELLDIIERGITPSKKKLSRLPSPSKHGLTLK